MLLFPKSGGDNLQVGCEYQSFLLLDGLNFMPAVTIYLVPPQWCASRGQWVECLVYYVCCSLQHFVLAMKLLVAYAIPDIPHKVAEEKARLEFLRREALKVRSSGLSHQLCTLEMHQCLAVHYNNLAAFASPTLDLIDLINQTIS